MNQVATELRSLLGGPAPWGILSDWQSSGRLARDLPEIAALFGVPQNPLHHPEIDTGRHSLLVLRQACGLSADPALRYAALVHDLGKALTPPAEWPRHLGHEESGLAPISALGARLNLPADWTDLALAACRWHLLVHKAAELRPATVHDLLAALSHDWQDEARLEKLLLVCQADARGRLGLEQRPYPQADLLRRLYVVAAPAGGGNTPAQSRERRIAAIRTTAKAMTQ
ncbi:HD domain-containing protein [Ferrovibrio sp.]|uniref:HD domain-containing protein n=1 Tax=Ferrovibrio sp. TaxID=1917215 RepID=UPI001B6CD4DD|nr:HD domain-containing protein [Ferrovibrio sp.]MBP7062989.1 HD domain-containing protein [Ferrovibrio sp.]